MNLADTYTELGTALGSITGLRVYPWAAKVAAVPAAIMPMPEGIDFHTTYGASVKKINNAMVIVLVDQVTARTAMKKLGDYTASTGSKSVKTALENYAYTTCDSVTVTSVDFDVYTLGGPDYLSAKFNLDIFCSGA